MISNDAKTIYDELLKLAPPGVIANDADDYPAFGVLRGNQYRIAVHVGRKGSTFFTDDQILLNRLGSAGVTSRKITPDEGRNRKRYEFPTLSVEQIAAHSDDFRKLISDSVKMKENGD